MAVVAVFTMCRKGESLYVLVQGVDAGNLSTLQSCGFLGVCINLYATLNKLVCVK